MWGGGGECVTQLEYMRHNLETGIPGEAIKGACSVLFGFFFKVMAILVQYKKLLYFSDHHSEILHFYSLSFQRNIKMNLFY